MHRPVSTQGKVLRQRKLRHRPLSSRDISFSQPQLTLGKLENPDEGPLLSLDSDIVQCKKIARLVWWLEQLVHNPLILPER